MKRVPRAVWLAGWPARMGLLALVRAYRLTLGQLTGGNCRFYPSCSEYAERAIASVGAARGSALALWRILRCSPLSGGGLDPAPLGRWGVPYDGDIRPTAAGVPGNIDEVAR